MHRDEGYANSQMFAIPFRDCLPLLPPNPSSPSNFHVSVTWTPNASAVEMMTPLLQGPIPLLPPPPSETPPLQTLPGTTCATPVSPASHTVSNCLKAWSSAVPCSFLVGEQAVLPEAVAALFFKKGECQISPVDPQARYSLTILPSRKVDPRASINHLHTDHQPLQIALPFTMGQAE